ncbi:ribosomal-protein-alanine acetyltransferase [Thecamonas trahens ATCC 50062]|uniref:Ribosomal-protein-alanine acetyltransferase n=1 Tax=Thecamonas trahens ATCC 50062 TaxID=461836 RepID=A0A0L0DE58_THETB|nr:ribosomal-protein-alanine acetyltransferase [Thecamonas trahens ATCC 50062]KNC50515.1 ribosomal-protein-alanine acetyltransferase [Thecamonas trahens ATCC 50062]|eukprot:XP_013762407.1 ribosomal-protein-alanine acetyltransferase [Thecamonas trahens ATCC 50062]
MAEPSPEPQHVAVHNAVCDVCQLRIIGLRMRCTGCVDFDVCGDCFVEGGHVGHATNHILIPIPLDGHDNVEPPTSPAAPVVHPMCVCDGCFPIEADIVPVAVAPLVGARWLCLVCDDVDLCERCFAADTHPPAHPMLRIARPLSFAALASLPSDWLAELDETGGADDGVLVQPVSCAGCTRALADRDEVYLCAHCSCTALCVSCFGAAPILHTEHNAWIRLRSLDLVPRSALARTRLLCPPFVAAGKRSQRALTSQSLGVPHQLSAPKVEIELDVARDSDVPAVASLDAACFDEPWPEDAFWFALDHPHVATLLVARAGDFLAGYILFGMHVRRRRALITSLAVDNRLRGRCIGASLLDEATAVIAASGTISEIVLHVAFHNEPAERLYRSLLRR